MKNHLPIYIYGAIIVLAGVFLMFSYQNNFNGIKWTLGIIFIIGAVFALISAFARQRKQVQFVYHEMHALAMLVYGITILIFSNSLEKFTAITAFIFIFYTFSEIIFCIWLFNLIQKVVFKIVAIRAILGLTVGIGTIVAMYFEEYTFLVFGVLFVIVGINILFYVPVLKSFQFTEPPSKSVEPT